MENKLSVSGSEDMAGDSFASDSDSEENLLLLYDLLSFHLHLALIQCLHPALGFHLSLPFLLKS